MKYYIFSIVYSDEKNGQIQKPFYLTTMDNFYSGTIDMLRRIEDRIEFYRKMKNEGFIDINKFKELLNNLINMYNIPNIDLFILEEMIEFKDYIVDIPDEFESLKKDINEIYKEMKVHDQKLIDDAFKKEFPSDVKRET